jgi:hypothetical protein
MEEQRNKEHEPRQEESEPLVKMDLQLVISWFGEEFLRFAIDHQ